jgi:5'-3' exoribonuclease 2
VILIINYFRVVSSYVEGLCWVLKYYYQGVQSWKWFYPFHYSPFASDFKDVSSLTISFEKSQPFKPIEQLMGVFPAASKQHIPAIFHDLMTDPESPIVDFYPTDFPIDLNGKKYAWQGVALLPFINADRLLKAMESLYPKLSPDEVKRNSMGHDILFASSFHSNFENLCALYRTPPIKTVCSFSDRVTHYLTFSLLPLAHSFGSYQVWPDFWDCFQGSRSYLARKHTSFSTS